ncbi:glucose-6-phosphate isomerase [archaeon]|nr:glucose-6-phosphate isomerase [archaeon]
MDIRNLNLAYTYTTKDGSKIFELCHPANSKARNLSLAIAYIEAGSATKPHIHKKGEEIYYILDGKGKIYIDDKHSEVNPGECVFIPLEAKHWIENNGKDRLVILCTSSPAYSHDDTELI